MSMRLRRGAVAGLALAGAGASCGYDTLDGVGFFLPDDGGSSDGLAGDGASDGGGVSDESASAPDGTPGVDGSNGVDGGPGTRTAELGCGSSVCSIPGQSCCVESPQAPSFACVNGSNCPVFDSGSTAGQPGVSLKCGGAANCPAGTTCCIAKIQNDEFARCTPVCGTGEAQLCEPNASVSGCSNVSGSCSSANVASWGLPPSYGTCGGVAAQ